MNKAAWASFWAVAFIWGSSFLLIRVGVEGLSATQVVFIRTSIAAVFLTLTLYLTGGRLPRDWPTIRSLIIIGIGNAAIPYTFISLGEQTITSGMAAVLQSTASLFTLIIAHFIFADERITRKKVLGLIVGFLGVLVLSSGSIEGTQINVPVLLGQLAIVMGSLFYGIFTVYSRTVIKKSISPMVISAGTFIPAAICAFAFMLIEPLIGGRAAVPLSEASRDTVIAVLILGFFNTFIAYIFFYYIVQELGAFRASMVTYVVPVIGLVLGAVVLREVIELYMIIGAVLIFAGIGIINVTFTNRRLKPAVVA